MENEELPPGEILRVRPDEAEELRNRYYTEAPRDTPPGLSSEERFFSQFMKGDMTLAETIYLMDYQDRKERRAAREDKPSLTADTIVEALEKAGITGKPPSDEMPEWAKKMDSQMTNINKKLEEDAQDKKNEELIEKVTKPLQDQLDREREDRKRLEEKIEDMIKPPSPGDTKTGMDQYIDYQGKLKAAGFLKEDKNGSRIILGEDGIPVSGEIPAWVVYAPTFADQILDNIENRMSRIAGTFGIGGKNKELRDLIDLPDKPKREVKSPPVRHVDYTEPQEELEHPAVEETPVEEEIIEPEETPIEELIKLPARTHRLTTSAEEPESPEEEAPEEPEAPPEEVQEEEAPIPEPDTELPEEPPDTVTDEEPEVEKKQYFCQYCGEGPFSDPLQLGRHVKNCPEAKEAKGE